MTRYILPCLLAFALLGPAAAFAQVPLEQTTLQSQKELPHAKGFVARGDSVQLLLSAVGAEMRVGVITSAKAQKKALKGSFDLAEPRKLLDSLSADLGLTWYSDKQSLYVYDVSETENAVGHLNYASIATLTDFLSRAGLIDARFPVRGGAGSGTFYVAGPPVYVQIVLNAARYLDGLYRDADAVSERIEVIKLQNTFVNSRVLPQRDRPVTVPGMALVISQALAQSGWVKVENAIESVAPVKGETPMGEDVAQNKVPRAGAAAPSDSARARVDSAVIVPYIEANSLVVRGTLSQIQIIRNLVAQLDVPRRQVELSLYIIDIKRNELEKMGALWSGAVGIANKFGASFNEGNVTSTLDGARFLVSISALAQKGRASIVSRPILLTQENVPALFDSNTSFYTRLEGERAVSLEQVTYGTVVSVIPRVSDENHVEMQVRVEDGSASDPTTSHVDGMPIVSRTILDTVARVPPSLSLLLGGYTRDSKESGKSHVPGLARVPLIGKAFRNSASRHDEVARLFLIQPRVVAVKDMLTQDAVQGLTGLAETDPEAFIRELARQPIDGGDL